jgi:hypothetical protein
VVPGGGAVFPIQWAFRLSARVPKRLGRRGGYHDTLHLVRNLYEIHNILWIRGITGSGGQGSCPYSTFGHANITSTPLISPPIHLNLTLPSLQSGKTRAKVPLRRTLRTSAVAPRLASSSLLRRS